MDVNAIGNSDITLGATECEIDKYQCSPFALTDLIAMDKTEIILEIKRSDFILDHWRKDFPKVADLKWDQISKLISRSEALQDWYFGKLESMKVLVEMPSWSRDIMSIGEFEKVRNDIKSYSEAVSELSAKIAKVALERNEEIEKIRRDFRVKWDTTRDNDMVYIFTLSSSMLPIRTLMDIENYEQKSDKELTKSQYARKQLDDFKRKLFNLSKEGTDIRSYVNDEALKF